MRFAPNWMTTFSATKTVKPARIAIEKPTSLGGSRVHRPWP
jgi:hypothetical protein